MSKFNQMAESVLLSKMIFLDIRRDLQRNDDVIAAQYWDFATHPPVEATRLNAPLGV
jgi:hypothetical protein